MNPPSLKSSLVRACGWLLLAGALARCGAGGTDTHAEGQALFSEQAALAATPSNCIGAPSQPNGPTSYPEGRIFFDAQGWWGDGSNPPQLGAAEHLHVGTCFPDGRTLTGRVRFDVRVMAHNLPAGTVITTTRIHEGGSGVVLSTITWNRTIASGESDVALWATVEVDTALAPDGLREFRFLTKAVRPDKDELHATTGWQADLENGKTDVNYRSSVNHREARGWYSCFEYKNSRFTSSYPWAGVPAGSAYTFNTALVDGAGGDSTVVAYEVRLDTDLHAGQNGALLASGSGSFSGSVTIPASLMTRGMHRLLLVTKRKGSCTTGTRTITGEVSGAFVVPIQVN